MIQESLFVQIMYLHRPMYRKLSNC